MQVPMTPNRILKRAVKLYPNKVAVIDGSVRFTYSQVRQRVTQLANATFDLKLSPGARVAVLDYNTHRYMELYYAMAQSGRVLLPLNILISPDDYSYILNDAEVEALIFHADFKPKVDQFRKTLKTKISFFVADGPADEDWITGTYEDLVANSSTEGKWCDPDDENDLLNLYYTSGTTGRPKGVMLTHRNIYVNALATIITFTLKDSTVFMHVAPLFHIADAFFIWAVTYQGGAHVMMRQFRPKAVLQTMQDEKITDTLMVPTMISCILEMGNFDLFDLTALEKIMVGGASMSPANAKRMKKKFGCEYVPGYGLTETCPLLAAGNLKETLSDQPEDIKIDHITRTGLEVVGVDLRVVNKNGGDVPWDGMSVGEIIVRGDNVMKGYWNLPDETAKVMKNGYFYTGDLANVDSEGYIFIVDRAKDIIIRSGENIASVEIENFLYAHPAVLDCAVIAFPDKRWGEVPKALVTLKQEATVTEKELVSYCRKGLARFKVPKYIVFIDEMPKTGSGKIMKIELRKRYGSSIGEINGKIRL